ncbi:tRNA (carboxymethyluridine(34)-5-O)-methyltransferase [Trametes pubescens]|uniref:tRNA (Carboxymethyluridine(34)-5-O)-methyltransferase n=1 Tax=Trametes pubescens TaxID=154538 RepID=A0A1M2VT69_TRAPU|nr:tRNA (carboxymethyluridine(34)-5-O)-methyltransferase [Trametes pubescens]
MPTVKATTVSADDPQTYEDAHVHAVYDEIAPHFSSTRYKPWPIIAAFLSSLPAGSVGVDLGTGNGKYLPLPSERPGSVWTVGLDRSRNLLQIAKQAGEREREVVWGDVLDGPWRPGAFVIEQDELSKRSIPAGADESCDTEVRVPLGKGQDVFVPWVLAHPAAPKPKASRRSKGGSQQIPEEKAPERKEEAVQAASKVFDRYYHMFAQGELNELVTEAAGEMGLQVGEPKSGSAYGVQIIQDGWERSNYFVELRRWKQ